MKLNVKAFAIAVALVWGLGIFIGTWWIIFLDGASSDMSVLGHIYRGYTITPIGSVIGMMWGLVDGLIGGAIFAWLYNLISTRT
jgi:hypothetical protein